MTARRTLASRGFVLPATPPKVGHARLDAKNEWNALALRMVVAEFLAPDLAPFYVIVAGRDCPTRNIIDTAAAADGFPSWMHGAFARMRCPMRNTIVNEWLGIPVEQIWPHHAQASARPVRAWRKPPAAGLQTEIKDGANATLMAPEYIGTPALCRPFVHTVPIWVNRCGLVLLGSAITVVALLICGGAR